MLEAQTRRIEDEGGTVAEAHLRLGRPAEEVFKLAEEIGAGIVVIGSRGLGALRRAVLGSVSENVVRYAPCPVFVVRGEGVEPETFAPLLYTAATVRLCGSRTVTSAS